MTVEEINKKMNSLDKLTENLLTSQDNIPIIRTELVNSLNRWIKHANDAGVESIKIGKRKIPLTEIEQRAAALEKSLEKTTNYDVTHYWSLDPLEEIISEIDGILTALRVSTAKIIEKRVRKAARPIEQVPKGLETIRYIQEKTNELFADPEKLPISDSDALDLLQKAILLGSTRVHSIEMSNLGYITLDKAEYCLKNLRYRVNRDQRILPGAWKWVRMAIWQILFVVGIFFERKQWNKTTDMIEKLLIPLEPTIESLKS